MVNLNVLAREIAEKEGGASNLPISQIKEVMKITFREIGKDEFEGLGFYFRKI